ncbi:MAG: hypothetical protein M3Y87_36775 [Myxococcota bacterium]|nr:hypothetical protein [Myxococcota bacterium]
MIGSIVLRGAGVVLAMGAEDLEVREGSPSRWSVKVGIAGDGLRIHAQGVLREDELPSLARDIDALVAGMRTAASLATEDGTLYLTIDRRGSDEAGVSIRLLRDRTTRAYSVVETRATRADIEDFARRAAKFPY